MNYVSAVKEFMQAFDQSVEETLCPNVSPWVRLLRIRLMNEELKETVDAIHTNDLVSLADGLADLLYVVFGTAISYGIPIDKVFEIVHNANMAKIDPVTNKPIKDEHGKVIKPEGWKSPNELIACLLLGHPGMNSEKKCLRCDVYLGRDT